MSEISPTALWSKLLSLLIRSPKWTNKELKLDTAHEPHFEHCFYILLEDWNIFCLCCCSGSVQTPSAHVSSFLFQTQISSISSMRSLSRPGAFSWFKIHCLHWIQLVLISHCISERGIKTSLWPMCVLLSSAPWAASNCTQHWLVSRLVCE